MTELSPTAIRRQPGLEMREAYESGAEVLLCFGVSGSKRWQAVAAGMPARPRLPPRPFVRVQPCNLCGCATRHLTFVLLRAINMLIADCCLSPPPCVQWSAFPPCRRRLLMLSPVPLACQHWHLAGGNRAQ